MRLSRPSQLISLILIFLAVWAPLTAYWAFIPSESWLASPLWNSFYLLLMGMVVITAWARNNDSIQLCSFCLMFVYSLSRAIYSTEPEYFWITPVIDTMAGLFCWKVRQRVVAGIFALMVAHFLIAKLTGIPAWRWQLRNNLLYIMQCVTAITMWIYPIIKNTREKKTDKPTDKPDNVLRLVIDEGAEWSKSQSKTCFSAKSSRLRTY